MKQLNLAKMLSNNSATDTKRQHCYPRIMITDNRDKFSQRLTHYKQALKLGSHITMPLPIIRA